MAKWSPQQDQALVAVDHWLRSGDQQVFRMFGYAGTGKTTLARHLAEGVVGKVLYGAYTGKAAHVMRQRGCQGASTIHSMIYHPKNRAQALLKEYEAELSEVIHEILAEMPLHTYSEESRQKALNNSRTVQTLRAKIEQQRKEMSRPAFTLNLDSEVEHAELVVIDEVTMVNGEMGEDLLSFGTKLLVLGDPAQLPPVKGSGFFTEGATPDIMLTEVHRQAQESPVLHLATQVREGRQLSLGSYGSSRVVERHQVDQNDALESDQVLVGRNKTRRASNTRVRQLLGHEGQLPVEGDRLVCLRNDHNVGLLNGAIWNVDEVGLVENDLVSMTVIPEEGGAAVDVEAHTHYFLGKEDKLNWWERKDAQEFDYGYALTVHKSQGSQWDDVLLFDESHCFRKDRDRHLYTAITRAAERVTVVKM